MPQLINGNSPQIFTAGSSLAAAPAQSASGLEIATMGNVKAQAQSQLLLGTAQTASGTSVDFLAIPTGVKRVSVVISDVSSSGTSPMQLQLGTSAGFETTDYLCSFCLFTTVAVSGGSNTAGLYLNVGNDSAAATKSTIITLIRVSGNSWAMAANITRSGGGGGISNASKTLAGNLDRIRLTTLNGTDTFDAGTVNILMEV